MCVYRQPMQCVTFTCEEIVLRIATILYRKKRAQLVKCSCGFDKLVERVYRKLGKAIECSSEPA